MVVSQETLDTLEDLGLNMYERKLYSALISRGVSTAGELSEMTGVPRSRSYDVLESLAEKGFTIIKPSKPMQYVAVPPKEALENTKKLHKKDLEEKLNRVERLKNTEAVTELEQLYDQGVERVDPADMSGAIKGKYNVHKQVDNMLKSAENSIKFMTTEEGLTEIAENHMNALKGVHDSGVDIRILAPVTEENKRDADLIKNVAEVKDLSEGDLPERPEGRFVIIDDEKLSLSLTHDDAHPTQKTIFWSESDHAASNAVGPMFEMAWERSKSF
ncbi:MAG: helix-turn-helix domain-containing protein [Candidatus Nanohaloarchaea archaeon]|nr:helix-turn-helix domain-containing protein [Candidatus Nanohaloarchaea archaeon]